MKTTIKNIKENLRIKLLLAFVFCFSALFGQKKQYFDINWDACDSKSASYYSIQYKEKGRFVQEDYFISGQLQMKAFYSDSKYSSKEGQHLYYHYNGNISLEKNYQNGRLNGAYKEYDHAGQIEREGQYVGGQKIGIWKSFEKGLLLSQAEYKDGHNATYTSYYDTGKIRETGKLYDELRTGKWMYYYASGAVYFEAYYQSNVRTGIWYFYYENGAKKAQIQFLLGKIKTEIYYDGEGMPKSAYGAHKLPQYKDGKEAYADFLKKCPLSPNLKGVKGNVVIGFTVNPDGQLSHFKIIKGLHDQVNKEALDYLKKSIWLPGKIYHESIPIEHAVSISFE